MPPDVLRRAVADAAQDMQAGRGRAETVQVAADAVRHLVPGCDIAAISVLTRDGLDNVVCSPASAGAPGDPEPGDGRSARSGVQLVDDLQYEIRQGPCHEAMAALETVHSPDMAAEQRWGGWAPTAVRELGMHSVVSHPLRSGGKVLGVLKVYGARTAAFSSDDIELVATFAAHVSVAIAAATQVEQLGDALDTRTLIGQATGLLMATYDLPADAAFAALARTSQTTNTKLRDLAAEVVRTRRLPDA